MVRTEYLVVVISFPRFLHASEGDLGPVRGGVHVGGGEAMSEADTDDVGHIILNVVVLPCYKWLLLLCLPPGWRVSASLLCQGLHQQAGGHVILLHEEGDEARPGLELSCNARDIHYRDMIMVGRRLRPTFMKVSI